MLLRAGLLGNPVKVPSVLPNCDDGKWEVHWFSQYCNGRVVELCMCVSRHKVLCMGGAQTTNLHMWEGVTGVYFILFIIHITAYKANSTEKMQVDERVSPAGNLYVGGPPLLYIT